MDVVISIKPQYVNLIVNKEKNHEFRNFIPKKGVSRLWVYSSSPVKKLKYVIDVDYIVTYPNLIKESGIGNDRFNAGISSTHAYHIKNLYELEEDLDLKTLKENFKFTAPQGYFYLENNKKLESYLKKCNLIKLF